jgi:uncharacterized protein
MKPAFTFTCTTCGSCCCEEGYVFFNSHEIELCAEFLGISTYSFKKKYLTKISSRYAHEVKKNSSCVFLENSKCIINDQKPEQCRTFPYWEEYIGIRGELVNFDRPCRGIFIKKDE